jgi:hypothetical protein
VLLRGTPPSAAVALDALFTWQDMGLLGAWAAIYFRFVQLL